MWAKEQGYLSEKLVEQLIKDFAWEIFHKTSETLTRRDFTVVNYSLLAIFAHPLEKVKIR